jgi:hypothetical protein
MKQFIVLDKSPSSVENCVAMELYLVFCFFECIGQWPLICLVAYLMFFSSKILDFFCSNLISSPGQSLDF